MRFIYSKTFRLFAIALLFLALLLFAQTRGWLSPVQRALLRLPQPITRATHSLTAPVGRFFSTIVSLRTITRENGELRQTLLQLQKQLLVLDQTEQENRDLRAQLGYKNESEFRLTSCGVLAIDPQGLSDTMVIDCGLSNGVRIGQAVVAEGFLVGRIVHAGSVTSTVVLITNPQSSIDARVATESTSGIIKGSLGSGIIFDLVNQTASLTAGDVLVTAGINSATPKGVLIGSVKKITSSANDLFKTASVESPLNFKNLRFVFVVE